MWKSVTWPAIKFRFKFELSRVMSLRNKSWAAAPQAAGLRPAAWGAIADHATDHRRPGTHRPGASHGIQVTVRVIMSRAAAQTPRYVPGRSTGPRAQAGPAARSRPQHRATGPGRSSRQAPPNLKRAAIVKSWAGPAAAAPAPPRRRHLSFDLPISRISFPAS